MEGFARGLTCPGHQHNGSSLKGNWILCKDDSVANLKASARRAGLAGISSGTEALKSAEFCTLFHLAHVGEGYGHNLAEAEGMLRVSPTNTCG